MRRGTRRDERGAQSLIAREVMAHPAPFSQLTPLHLRRAPVLLLAASFAGGVLCRSWWQPAADTVLCCALLLLCVAAAWWRAPRLSWPAACLFWTALGWTAAIVNHPVEDTSLLRYADELQRTVDAQVVAVRTLPPRAAPVEAFASGKAARRDEENAFAARDRVREASYSMDLDVHAIEDLTPEASRMIPIHGGAHVTVFNHLGTTAQPPPCGTDVSLTVRLHPPQRYLDPGVWQYADALALRGVSVESNADGATLRVTGSGARLWRCSFSGAQRWSTDRLRALVSSPALQRLPSLLRLTPDDAAILSAMLFGDRTQLGRGLRTSFERTGSFHLFVVAGVHVTLLLAMLYGLLLRLRAPRWLAALIALAATSAYAVLTGFGAPVQRALFMAAVYLLTLLISRERNPMNALGVAALAMLVARPESLFESSTQMTLLAVIAIAGIAWPVCERTLLPYARACEDLRSIRPDVYMPPRLAQFRVSLRWLGEELAQSTAKPLEEMWWTRALRTLPARLARLLLLGCELILITFCAELVMALPMAVYFHRITLFAAPTNLLVLPLIAVLMVCAIATFAAALLSRLLAIVPAAITALFLHTVTFIVGRFSSLHAADVRTPGPVLVCVVVACALWWASVVLLRLPAPRLGRLACLCVLLAFAAVLWRRHPQLTHGVLEFTALDVGQGDSLLVAAPDGHTMLIDAGGPTGSAALTEQVSFDTGEEVVSPYLWSRGLRHLDVAVLTHAHSDHIGGMASVLRNFSPHELWLSVDADTPPFRDLIQLAKNRGIMVRHMYAGDELRWNGIGVRVLSPARDYQPQDLPTNNDSLALEMQYGRASVLAEGDAEHPSEQIMLSEHPGPVTLLKVGHHGSNTSTGEAFLEAVHPRAAVISCGLGNRFGHPRMPVLERLQAADVQTSRTDLMGAVQYLLHADGGIDTHVLASHP